ncbi:retrovirus-related pol polyprotein from transposon TNT 1-94 [Tanacetum coccineum]
MMLKMVPETPLQFGVAERLSRTFRAESTGLRADAPKMLLADSISTTYLIYRIPYVLIGLRIPEEEWRGKDTSLTHLKVFGCDLFVKVKDFCREAIKCTFIGSGSNEMRYSFQDMMSHRVIRRRDITFVDSIYRASIVSKHRLNLEITQSQGGSSDTSEGSKNSRSFEDSGRSDEEYSKDGASSKEGGSEIHSYEDLPESLDYQHERRMFRVKEEHDGRKRYKARLVVKSFQHIHRVNYNEVFYPVVKMTSIRVLVSWERRKPSVQVKEKSVQIKASAKTMILISEGSLSLLKILGMKSLAEMFTRLRPVSLEERPIVVLGLRGGLLGVNPIPHR